MTNYHRELIICQWEKSGLKEPILSTGYPFLSVLSARSLCRGDVIMSNALAIGTTTAIDSWAKMPRTKADVFSFKKWRA